MTNPLCFFCWPRAVEALHTDDKGLPCCACCAAKPNKKCQVPSFIVARMRDVWPYEEERREAA